ncbi:insoluble matrix shell protein 1-like [Mytilus californianus]|uniref:insoluble matrix shell protein 1-like n=1 Tax=Mytilus californianus TaxID=6549 RepID=UPI0022463817|nr:insoluble matrix shell protein 1-like [Mytilus californianus]
MPHVEVTMHVFSGRENPKWKIDGNHHKFGDIVEKIESHVQNDMTTGLGYSGFTVRHDNTIYKIPKKSNIELEKLLLHSSNHVREAQSSSLQHFISKSVIDHVLGHLDGNLGQEGDLQLPAYDPRSWNIQSVQPYNNCYNYANNMKTNTFAQPGRASGLPMEEITGVVVQKNAEADGLQLQVVAEDGNVPINIRNLVALVIWPSQDFHWFRLDNNNQFSHKPGQSFVRDYDEDHDIITDPRQCNLGPYKFVTFMTTVPQLVHID